MDKITKNPVTLNSLSVWKLSHKLFGNKILLTSFSPIWKKKKKSCFNDDIFESWYRKGIQEFSCLFENVTFLSFAQLQQKYGAPSSPSIYIFFK